MKTRSEEDKSFEFWFFNVATASERRMPNETQAEAHQMWIMQEASWHATIEDLEKYGDPDDSFDFG